jgi:hypothetical protein
MAPLWMTLRMSRSCRHTRPTLTAAAAAVAVLLAGALATPASAGTKQHLTGHGVNEHPLTWVGKTPWNEDPATWPGADAEILGADVPPQDDAGLLEPSSGFALDLPIAPPTATTRDTWTLPSIPAPDIGPIIAPGAATVPAPGALWIIGAAMLGASRRRRR